jgi:tripartite-type tricarboxylate transporter receptor subunit TctC
MPQSNRKWALVRCVVLCLASLSVSAQEWPLKPLRIMVNVPPGGGIDQITRVAAPRLGEALGQTVVVDNRGGAGGNIGVELVAKSAPDGYTLLAAIGSTIVMGPHLYKLNFDMARDLLPIAPIARTLMFLVVRTSLPVNNVAELVAYARANPGKLNFGSPGVGTGPHIAAEMMLRAAKMQATHIPYKGSAETMAALFGNTIDFAFDPGSAVRQARAGKLRLLAVASASRTPLAPEAPSMAEAGVEVDSSTVHGLYAPAGTPGAIAARLHREFDRVMRGPEAVKAVAAVTAESVYATQEEFAAQLRRDRERYGVVIREAGIRAE